MKERSGVLGLRSWSPLAVVTEQKGSWRWQNAYRQVNYRIVRCPRGRTLYQWEACSRGPKQSEPQLRHATRDAVGTLHHRPVTLAMLAALARRHAWPPERMARLLRHAGARGLA